MLAAACLAAAVLVADQASKTWAVHRLARGPVHVIWKLDFVLSYNTGSAFGLARGWAPVVGGLALVLVVVLAAMLRRVETLGLALALGLVLGGALGNLADRVLRPYHGGVVDFIDFHFWPSFNVADSCITVGVLCAAWSLWRQPPGP